MSDRLTDEQLRTKRLWSLLRYANRQACGGQLETDLLTWEDYADAIVELLRLRGEEVDDDERPTD